MRSWCHLLYRGLQPLVAHAKTKRSNSDELHWELVALLDEEWQEQRVLYCCATLTTCVGDERTDRQMRENYSNVAFDVGNTGQIVRSESRPESQDLYARWHRMKGDLTM
ncbi:hypothetical protein V6N13_084865 [Hibiscus sabdariffa]